MAPFPAAAHRTERAVLPHSALGRTSRQGVRDRPPPTAPRERSWWPSLGLAIKLLPKSLSLLGSRLSSMPGLRLLPKHARTRAPSLHRHCPASTVLCAPPTPTTASRPPFGSCCWWSRPATAVGLSRCLDHRVHMPPPLPRLEMMGSTVGCSPTTRRPSPYGRRVGSSEILSGPAQGSLALRPTHLSAWLDQAFPEASGGRLPASTAPATTGAYRQLPGRDSHPRAIETQEVIGLFGQSIPILLS